MSSSDRYSLTSVQTNTIYLFPENIKTAKFPLSYPWLRDRQGWIKLYKEFILTSSRRKIFRSKPCLSKEVWQSWEISMAVVTTRHQSFSLYSSHWISKLFSFLVDKNLNELLLYLCINASHHIYEVTLLTLLDVHFGLEVFNVSLTLFDSNCMFFFKPTDLSINLHICTDPKPLFCYYIAHLLNGVVDEVIRWVVIRLVAWE